MDITLNYVLTNLDEHYNNVKALDALNKELFQLWMADKETVSDRGIHLSRHLQVRTYSDYLRATKEAEKEDSIELPQGPRTQTADGPPNQVLLASSP